MREKNVLIRNAKDCKISVRLVYLKMKHTLGQEYKSQFVAIEKVVVM